MSNPADVAEKLTAERELPSEQLSKVVPDAGRPRANVAPSVEVPKPKP